MVLTEFSKVQEAVTVIEQSLGLKPTVGVVLGSGLGSFVERLHNARTIPYQKIPHFPVSSVPGHVGQLVIGEIGSVICAVLCGRVHYYEGYSAEQVVFPIRVLARLGVQTLFITNAAGGINAQYNPGDFMIISDHLNLTGVNPLRGPNEEHFGPRFPDMSEPYSHSGQELLAAVGDYLGLKLFNGVYAGLPGPSYETKAEIKMLEKLGADAVGMSTVLEVIAARHQQLKVLGLSFITNKAAGKASTILSHQEVLETSNKMRSVFNDLLEETIKRLT